MDSNPFFAAFLDEGIYYVTESKAPYDHTLEQVADQKPEGKPQMESSHETVAKPRQIDYLGENKKQFTFVVNYNGEDHIIPKEQKVLHNVMAAVNLTLADVAIINLFRHRITSFEQLHEILHNRTYIGFGLPQAFFSQGTNQQFKDVNGAKLLLLDFSITQMSADKNLKRILWKNLQNLFGL